MTTASGAIPRLMSRLFGARVLRLSERLQHVHWLSYLLVLSQSVAVVLVLGHAELPLLWDPSWAIRALAAMGVFVLVATVIAADMALLETLRRVPVLARNRQRGQLREHIAYILFVLLIEASTYAVVLAALDSDPRALVTAAPLIPNAGPIFVAQVILRAVLVCWTAVQLVLVKNRLPVLLSTLTNTGKEIVGAHVERQLSALDIAGVALPDTFRLYAAMARPPRRVRTIWNAWLVERERQAEAEEERQTLNVIAALEELHQRALPPVSGVIEEYTDPNIIAIRPAPDPSTPTRSSSRRHKRRSRRPAEPAAPKVAAALAEQPDLGVRAVARKAGVAPSTASRYHPRRSTTTTPAAEAIAQ